MSAYERAWDAFRGVLTDKELDQLLKGVEREHAHELAEKIRMCRDDTRGAVQATKVMDFAADLIDPEVSNDGV